MAMRCSSSCPRPLAPHRADTRDLHLSPSWARSSLSRSPSLSRTTLHATMRDLDPGHGLHLADALPDQDDGQANGTATAATLYAPPTFAAPSLPTHARHVAPAHMHVLCGPLLSSAAPASHMNNSWPTWAPREQPTSRVRATAMHNSPFASTLIASVCVDAHVTDHSIGCHTHTCTCACACVYVRALITPITTWVVHEMPCICTWPITFISVATEQSVLSLSAPNRVASTCPNDGYVCVCDASSARVPIALCARVKGHANTVSLRGAAPPGPAAHGEL